MKIYFILRKRSIGQNSIEEIWNNLLENYPNEIEVVKIHLPFNGGNPFTILGNLLFTSLIPGRIHVTGDVNYLGLLFFKKLIITIHDINVLKLATNKLKYFYLYLLWYKLPLMLASGVTYISNHTKKECDKIYKRRKHSAIIYNPVNTRIRRSPNEGTTSRRILQIGTKAHKNIETVIEAANLANLEVDLVGRVSYTERNRFQRNGYRVTYHSELDFEEVLALYESCALVAFISSMEGFGMPILEAQSVGRLVIISDIEVLKEVAGKGAVILEDLNAVKLSELFVKCLSGVSEYQRIVSDGFENVRRFDIGKISDKYVQFYTSLRW